MSVEFGIICGLFCLHTAWVFIFWFQYKQDVAENSRALFKLAQQLALYAQAAENRERFGALLPNRSPRGKDVVFTKEEDPGGENPRP